MMFTLSMFRGCQPLAAATITLAMMLTAAAMFASPAARADQPLAQYQRIVVAPDALPVTKLAAEELSHYLSLMLRRDIPVVPADEAVLQQPGLSFFVGDTAAAIVLKQSPAPWQREEWMIKTVPQGLVLAGHDESGRGTSVSVAGGSALAVYTLLDEHLGVRWLWPGETGQYIPENPPASLPMLDLRQQPRFIIRTYMMGYSSYHNTAYRNDASLWARRTRQGWVPAATFGHSWYYAFDLKKKEDENPYFRENPEWFALVNGKRRPPQMCTTHPQVINRMVEYVLSDTRRAITTISPSDGAGFCQCTEETKSEYHKKHNIPSCTSLDVPGYLAYDQKTPQLSDRIFTYANEVARRVREKDPNKGVGMFAYTFYQRPPVNIKKLEPNLYLSFVFQAQSHVDPIMYDEWLQSIAGWKKLGAKMIVREGWGNHYLLDLPFIYPKEIHNSLHQASELGFIAAYGEGSKSFATQAPNTWAVVRTMWNPDINYNDMMTDFYNAAYGPAAAPMRAYFDTYEKALHDNWEKRRFITPSRGVGYVNLVNSWHIILPASAVDEAEAHLKHAEAITASLGSTNQYTKRVALQRVGQDYARMMLELLDCYRQLAELGMDMEFFSLAVEKPVYDLDRRNRILKRAYELGELREDMLLTHRDIPGPDEGLYAITNRNKTRQWHTNVKRLLEIEKPTRVTKELLDEMDKPAAAAAKKSAATTSPAPSSSNAANPAPAATPAATANTTANTADARRAALAATAPTWALPPGSTASATTGGPAVLALGQGYGRNEIAAIKREVFDSLYTHATVSEEWVPASQWHNYKLVIVANLAEPLRDEKEQAALVNYVSQDGRVLLLGTVMRSFEKASPDTLAAIGASGYAVIRNTNDTPIQINHNHPDILALADAASELPKAFATGYGLRTLQPNVALLINTTHPAAYIHAHGQGRVAFIGRELFRVRIEEKRDNQTRGGNALRDLLKSLVHQIAPAQTKAE